MHLLHVGREKRGKYSRLIAIRSIVAFQAIPQFVGGIILLHYFGHVVGLTPSLLLNPVAVLLFLGYALGLSSRYSTFFSREQQAALLQRVRRRQDDYDLALCCLRGFLVLLIVWFAVIAEQRQREIEVDLSQEKIEEFLKNYE